MKLERGKAFGPSHVERRHVTASPGLALLLASSTKCWEPVQGMAVCVSCHPGGSSRTSAGKMLPDAHVISHLNISLH